MPKHHIIPRHAGGSDDPSNLVDITHTQHIMYHFAEWQRTGCEYDRIAYRAMAGKTPDREEARRQAASHYMSNRVVSQETRNKISQSRKGKPLPARRGKLHSEEAKKQMSASAIKHRGSPVYCVELDKTWDSVVSAEAELGIPRKQIKKAASPCEVNKTSRGLHFIYVKHL